MKMVFGVGIGLVIGAILPSLFSKGSKEKTAPPLPAWNAGNGGSLSAAAQTVAPTWTPPKATVVTPQTPLLGISTQPPSVGDYLPGALNRHSWSPPRTSATPPIAPPANPVNADYAQRNPPVGPAQDRLYAPPADRRALQADSRNDPAPRYGSDAGYDYRGQPIEGSAIRRDNQVPGAPADYRNNDNRYYNADPSAARVPVTGPGSPLMPSGSNGAGNYRNTPYGEPGVARFEDNIATPPARTNYERSGPSNY